MNEVNIVDQDTNKNDDDSDEDENDFLTVPTLNTNNIDW